MSEWKETAIGRMPSHWDAIPIGVFGDVTKLAGFEYTKYFTYVEDGEIIALRALNVRNGVLDLDNVKRIRKTVSDELIRSKLIIDDIVFTYTGANYGQFALIDHNDKYHLAPNICRIRTGSKCLPYYLFSYFRASGFQENLVNYVHGSSQPTIPMGNIRKIEIPIPPIEEQEAITAVLSSLDDKIDLLHRQNKTLEALAQTLFRHWFVDGAEDDWGECVITELFEIRDGTHDSPKQKNFGKPLVTSKHIKDFRLDFYNAYLISEDDYAQVNRRSKVETFDILFSMIGTIGLTFLEQSKTVEYAIKNVGLFKTSQNPDWAFFAFLWLNSSFGREFIFESRSGSTQQYISLGSLRSIVFSKPPQQILEEFNSVVRSLFSKIQVNQEQIQTLEQLRETLLPKLMSGKVRVRL